MDESTRPVAIKKRELRIAVIQLESQSSSFPLLRTTSTSTPSPAAAPTRPRTQSAAASGTRAAVKSSPPRRKTAQVDGANKKRKTTPPHDKSAGSLRNVAGSSAASGDGTRQMRPALTRQISTASNCRRKFVGNAEFGDGIPTEEEDKAKKRLTLVFGIVATTLFLLAVLMVAIGLRMSSPGPNHPDSEPSGSRLTNQAR